MWNNYLKIAFRNLMRQKVFSLINIVGLSAGIAVCLMIALWISFQFSFDKFHKNIDDLYMVPTSLKMGNQSALAIGSGPALAPVLKNDFPEVVDITRWQSSDPQPVQYQDNVLNEEVTLVDPGFLKIFSFPLVEGDSETALNDLNSIVLTKSFARKLFGTEDPMGKTVLLMHRFPVIVRGIAEDIPANSTLKFSILANIKAIELVNGPDFLKEWGNLSFPTYVQLRPDVDPKVFNEKMKDRVAQELESDELVPFLFPFAKRHLYYIGRSGGRIESVRLFMGIAIGILLIACINFINLTTARFSKRAKEVGVRKVIGAERHSLMIQFFTESMLQVILAAFLSLAIIELFSNQISDLLGGIGFYNFGYFEFIGIFAGIILLTGLMAGSYPAVFLSAFHPAVTLKGALKSSRSLHWFRRCLVLVQFILSISLIICTIVVQRQHTMMVKKDLGFDHDQILYFALDEPLNGAYDELKNSLEANPGILTVTRATHAPTGIWWNGTGWDWEGKDPDFDPLVSYLGVDFDYLKTFGIDLSQGHFYNRDLTSQLENSIVINQTFAKQLGWDNPVGKILHWDDRDLTILGVVKDFYYMPVNYNLSPLVMLYKPEVRDWRLFAKIRMDDLPKTLAFIKETCKAFSPNFLLEYHFLDDELNRLYAEEVQLRNIMRIFSLFAILISCSGLFGLASFTAEQRTKEIGIRKALGATIPAVVRLLSVEYLLLVIIANIVAWPISYWFMSRWLEDYAYRINISFWILSSAGIAALLIAILSVAYQALKAATANPAKSLHYE